MVKTNYHGNSVVKIRSIFQPHPVGKSGKYASPTFEAHFDFNVTFFLGTGNPHANYISKFDKFTQPLQIYGLVVGAGGSSTYDIGCIGNITSKTGQAIDTKALRTTFWFTTWKWHTADRKYREDFSCSICVYGPIAVLRNVKFANTSNFTRNNPNTMTRPHKFEYSVEFDYKGHSACFQGHNDVDICSRVDQIDFSYYFKEPDDPNMPKFMPETFEKFLDREHRAWDTGSTLSPDQYANLKRDCAPRGGFATSVSGNVPTTFPLPSFEYLSARFASGFHPLIRVPALGDPPSVGRSDFPPMTSSSVNLSLPRAEAHTQTPAVQQYGGGESMTSMGTQGNSSLAPSPTSFDISTPESYPPLSTSPISDLSSGGTPSLVSSPQPIDDSPSRSPPPPPPPSSEHVPFYPLTYTALVLEGFEESSSPSVFDGFDWTQHVDDVVDDDGKRRARKTGRSKARDDLSPSAILKSEGRDHDYNEFESCADCACQRFGGSLLLSPGVPYQCSLLDIAMNETVKPFLVPIAPSHEPHIPSANDVSKKRPLSVCSDGGQPRKIARPSTLNSNTPNPIFPDPTAAGTLIPAPQQHLSGTVSSRSQPKNHSDLKKKEIREFPEKFQNFA